MIEERRQLYSQKRTKEVRNKITQISKKINREISENTKTHRKNTLEKYISKTGAVKRAYKELCTSSQWTSHITDKTGNKITSRLNIIEEATTFYKELYSTLSTEIFDICNLQKTKNVEKTPPILLSEIDFAIKTQKNNKSPGEDKVTNELLKSISEPLQRPLQIMFNNILEQRKTPNQWSRSTTTLLHKKGDRDNLNNYRPISLMSNVYKIFSKIVLNRLSKVLDENQPREQAGFRKTYSTIDHIHVMTQLIEKIKEYGGTLYICFIDFTKAFDSLEHDAIWKALIQQNLDTDYIELLYSIYSKSSTKIKLEREGPEFDIKKGVRQGDPLSPKIFSAVLEHVIRNIDWERQGIEIDGEYMSHLRFADDIAIFAENAAQLENMVNDLARESKKVGLSLNATKTKIISNGREQVIKVNGKNIEYVTLYAWANQSHLKTKLKKK